MNNLKDLALLIAVNCVRNTVLEDFHTEGRLSDDDMKRFNKEVSNKVFTFLHYLIEADEEDKLAFMQAMSMMYPSNWDTPKFDKDFRNAVKKIKEQNAEHR